MIVCDTNIFYDLGQGAIAKSWFQNEQITGTLLSQLEFNKSYKMIDRMSELQGAAKAMKNHCSDIIEYMPPDFSIRRFIPDYKPLPESFVYVKYGFESLLKGNLEVKPEAKRLAKTVIQNYEKPLVDLIDNENNRLSQRPKIPQAVRDQIKLADFTHKSKLEIIDSLQLHNSENFPNTPIVIDVNSDVWNDFELFVHLYTDYHKLFIEKKGKRMKKNDLIDLTMTMYVGRNDYFWTNDDFWINLIKANPITSKYLYPLSGRRRF